MLPEEFLKLLVDSLSLAAKHSADGSIHFVCIDWRHIRELTDSADDAYTELKNICVWSKSNAGMGSLYRSAHEFIFVYKNGRSKHINNVELGRFGRSRTNIWEYVGMSSFAKDRDATLAGHPTPKPLALVSDAILDCSKRGGIVLDAFAGSGTTLLAAEQTFQMLNRLTAEAGLPPNFGPNRRSVLEKTLIRQVKTYQQQLLPHLHERRAKRTEVVDEGQGAPHGEGREDTTDEGE
jgi:hypothetical protein